MSNKFDDDDYENDKNAAVDVWAWAREDNAIYTKKNPLHPTCGQ